jgi:hypothetical protein
VHSTRAQRCSSNARDRQCSKYCSYLGICKDRAGIHEEARHGERKPTSVTRLQLQVLLEGTAWGEGRNAVVYLHKRRSVTAKSKNIRDLNLAAAMRKFQ